MDEIALEMELRKADKILEALLNGEFNSHIPRNPSLRDVQQVHREINELLSPDSSEKQYNHKEDIVNMNAYLPDSEPEKMLSRKMA